MPPRFPETAMVAPRTEHTRVPLTVFEGALPAGLTGHVYWLSPVGTVDTPGGPPYPNRPSVINGDGMVFRADFNGGTTNISSRIVKTPDYWADLATKDGSPFSPLGFHNFGMLRASPFLGARDFANTAFVPVTKPGSPPRLLCCYDAGRPFEIDPHTLATITPVGATSEWRAEALASLPFPPILATAHPFWDPNTQELFAVNYGRSVLSLLETIPAIWAASTVPKILEIVITRLAGAFGLDPRLPPFWRRLLRVARGTFQAVLRALGIAIPEDFLYLVRWDGAGPLERFRIVDRRGRPAVVQESMHQVAATRDWVVLMDTNFKLRFDQFYSNPFPDNPVVERLLRTMLATQQGVSSTLWFVKRADLGPPGSGAGPTPRAVRAIPIEVPMGAVHFLADYENPGDIVRLHVAHGTALDIAEWVREYDLDALRRDQHLPAILAGMIASEVDVSRLGLYEIDVRSGRMQTTRIASDDDVTWGIALYAGQGVPAWAQPPARFASSFWFCSGLWRDLMSAFIRDLYAQYPDRMVAIDRVERLLRQGGRPSTLFRLDVERMAFPDTFTFPPDATLSSPQFVPRDPHATDAPGAVADADGWICCACWTPTGSELWVFDAAALAAGPVAKLRAPGVQFGFSMHSAWLPETAPRVATYMIDAHADLGPRAAGNPDIERVFTDHVFPGLAAPVPGAEP